jgi:hypothetical protein
MVGVRSAGTPAPRRSVCTVVSSLEEIDAVLGRTGPIGESTAAGTLRQWRTDLVRTSVFVSYAIGVLSLDKEILTRGDAGSPQEVLATAVDDLPDLLATGWVGGGWSLSPDATASVAAAAEVAMEGSEGLLRLHADVVMSDLGDPDVVRDLLADVAQLLSDLMARREELESRIRRIQEIMLAHYASGAASVDDWLA